MCGGIWSYGEKRWTGRNWIQPVLYEPAAWPDSLTEFYFLVYESSNALAT